MTDEFHFKSKLADQLEHFILHQLEPNPGVRHDDPRELTIGIEHEFFLASPDGEPATHEQSQLFLKTFSQVDGWHIQQVEAQSSYEEYIARVSKNHANGRFTALKYDHHPHLLEVAFGYTSSMDEMSRTVSDFFSLAETIADKASLRVLNVPNIPHSPSDQRVISDLTEFKNLRHYRKLLMNQKLATSNYSNINYAAVIAATQTHIGGTQWWRRPSFVRSLYSFEPLLVSHAIHSLAKSDSAVQEILHTRWQGYRDVFADFPLVAFPKLADWSLKQWVAAMLDSPLYGGYEDIFSGKTINELHQNPFHSWKDFMKSVRDLQLIRPKLFGTLEFRADPAQPDCTSIIAMSSLRLGICSALIGLNFSPLSFVTARESWESSVTAKSFPLSNEVLSFAIKGLRKRGFGEEKYLKDFEGKELSAKDEEKATG